MKIENMILDQELVNHKKPSQEEASSRDFN